MKTEDFQVFWYLGVVQYVRKIYQTAVDVPKKNKKTCSERLGFSKSDKPSNENGGFSGFWYPGVVQYVHKIYQTAADVPKKVKQTCSERLVFSKSDKHSNENGGFSCVCVSGCCSIFS